MAPKRGIFGPGQPLSQAENLGAPHFTPEEGLRSVAMSEERNAPILSSKSTESAAQGFTLPGILPERTWILLDTHARMVIFLKLDSKEATPLFRAFPLTPSATRVFLALLRSYPQCCPYQTLLCALYPASQEEHAPAWEHHVRPIRRALVALAPVLQTLGLDAIALRGHGYMLVPAALSSQKKKRASKAAS